MTANAADLSPPTGAGTVLAASSPRDEIRIDGGADGRRENFLSVRFRCRLGVRREKSLKWRSTSAFFSSHPIRHAEANGQPPLPPAGAGGDLRDPPGGRKTAPLWGGPFGPAPFWGRALRARPLFGASAGTHRCEGPRTCDGLPCPQFRLGHQVYLPEVKSTPDGRRAEVRVRVPQTFTRAGPRTAPPASIHSWLCERERGTIPV